MVHRYGLESLEEYKTRVHEICNQTSFDQKTFNEGPENRDKNTYDSSFEDQNNRKEPNISFEKLEDSQFLFDDKKDPQSTDTTNINEIAAKINHHRDIDSEPSLITPPPSPSISHLRRWLAPLEEELPKAS